MILAMLMTVAWASEPQEECFPPCRSGYLCHKGSCLSRCNPECDDGERCTDDGECEAKGASQAAKEAKEAKDPDVPPSPMGEICVFRSRFFVGSLVQFSLLDGDKRVATLNVGQYHCWSAQAGTRLVTLTNAASGMVVNGTGSTQGPNSTMYEITVPAGDVVYYQMRLHKLWPTSAEDFANESKPYKPALHTKDSPSSMEWVRRHRRTARRTTNDDRALAQESTPEPPKIIAEVAPADGEVCVVRSPDDTRAYLPISWIEGAVLLGTQVRDKPLCWNAAPGPHRYVASASGSTSLQIDVMAGSSMTIVTHTEAFEGTVRPVLKVQTTAAP